VLQAARSFLSEEGLLELETPILTRSTPEGARDYLVPSRVNKGRFYALPQSPQLFKQLFMVSGFDRYFQICRCFRDEDLRADRQPEFTQIDVEMSFVEQEDVLKVIERLMVELFQKCLGVEIGIPFKRYSHKEALALFGSDKPDLRYGSLVQEDVTDLVKDTDFEIFRKVVKAGGKVKGFSVPGQAAVSRKNLDDLTKFAIERGAGGLAWMKVEEGGLTSPIVKFFKQETLGGLRHRLGASAGDLLLMVADQPAVTDQVLAALRAHVADLYHLKTDSFGFAWVTDFPLLERNEEEKRFEAVHHPFTAPVPDDVALFETSPERIRSQAYDLVLNGQEIGGGSIRIHQRKMQERMFSALGISAQAAREKFGFLLEALEYGTPPHGGIALGLDRIVAIMAGEDSIRDVIPFPKTQRAIDMMVDAPSPVEEDQLKELGIDLKPPD
jgi:aspartyl-tRNA synthetase